MKFKSFAFFAALLLNGACNDGGASSKDGWEAIAVDGFILQAGEPVTWVSRRPELEGATVHILEPHDKVIRISVTLERHKSTREIALLVKGDRELAHSFYVTLPKQLVEAHGESHIREHGIVFEANEPTGAALVDILPMDPKRITDGGDGIYTVEPDRWGRMRPGDEDYDAEKPSGRFEPRGQPETNPFDVTTAQDSGKGSLRQAILDANAAAGVDTVVLKLPSTQQVIQLFSPLPVITDKIVMEGRAAEGFSKIPLVILDGSPIGGSILVLGPGSDGSIIRAVNLVGATTGIEVQSSRNVIMGNYIGVSHLPSSRTKIVANPNETGILIGEDASHNIIGSPYGEELDANVIGGNLGAGIVVKGSDNVIAGNDIGYDAEAMEPFPNDVGIAFDASARNNSVGGEDWLFRNLIRGNTSGDVIQGGEGNTVHGDQSGEWLGL